VISGPRPDPPGLDRRALIAAGVVAAIVGGLFPYVTLALGFGPNTSLIATFLGFGAMSTVGARGRGALVASQAAGVAAGQTAVMGTALAALDLLRARGVLEVDLRPSSLVVFAWLASAGALGVLAALPLRRHYIEDENLAFPAGTAAGEAIVALDDRRGLLGGHRALAGALAVGALATIARFPLSPLGLGSGLLIGARIAASIGLGAALTFALPAPAVAGIAAALLVAGGATRALLRAPGLARALRRDRPRPSRAERRAPLRLLALAAGVAALCAIDRVALATPVGATLASIALAGPLLLVGTRVLGETNWAPVGSLAAVAQIALGAIVPGCAVVNLIGSTVAAAIPNAAQHTVQSFRAAAHAGTRPRDTALAQLLGVVVGAAMLSVTYPLLAARFGVGGHGLAAPLSVAWADVAVAVTRGHGVLGGAIAAAALAGVVLALAEARVRFAPSPIGLGIGLILSWPIALAVALGGALDQACRRRWPHLRAPRVAVASGLVAGEAMTATVTAVVAGLAR
jgi:uncharacterized oligopeptide transporter (OPT) family protein